MAYTTNPGQIDQSAPDPISTSTPSSSDAPLLYRFEGRVQLLPIGRVPEGIRVVLPFEGTVTEGEFLGGRVWGTDHLLLRPDLVGVIDAPKTISDGDRHVFEHLRGYCLPPAGLELPPLEAVLAPDFQWPDALFPVTGFSTFRTGDPGLAHLNRAIATVEGWSHLRSGRLAIETRLFERSGTVRGPAAVPAGI